MIIDFHTHAYNPKVARRAVDSLHEMSGISPLTHGGIDELINRFDEWGVDKGVLLSVATKPTQPKLINDWAAEVNRENERLIAFGSIFPTADDTLEELERIKKLGLHGIKLHSDFQRFMIDDPMLDDIYSRLEEMGLPVVFHAGLDFVSPDLIHAPPERTLKMLKRHPKLKAVLAHLGGNEMWENVYELLAGIDGEVYFDTSFTAACPDALMKKIIGKHGAERILLGSDCPWESTQKMIEKLLRIDITDGEREKIMGLNAQRLLSATITA